MKTALSTLLTTALLASPLALAASATAAPVASTPAVVQKAAPAKAAAVKANRKFTRVGFTGASQYSWYGEELVKLGPAGGKRHIYLQIRKPGGKWQNQVRQTTTSAGHFNLGNYSWAARAKFKTVEYRVGKIPTFYYQRVVAPGGVYYNTLTSPTWYYDYS